MVKRKAGKKDKMVAEAKEKSITSSTPTQIDKMVAESKEKSDLLQENYSPPNFHNFLKIKCKSTTPKFELLKLIQSEKIVEYAYIRGRSFPGSEPQITESFTRRQRYLKAAPVGINAKFARQNGGDGKGNFRFIDIEDGWSHLNQAHPD